MVNPDETINLDRVFQGRTDSSQKLGSLSLTAEVLPGGEYLERLANLVEHVKQFAEPLPSGKAEKVEPSFNFITPRRPVSQTEEGVLELGFFIYTAPDNNESSINASWTVPGQDRPKLVRQEYLSTRNFNPRIAAYRENSPQVLVELEAAVDVYEQAATTVP